MFSFLLKKKDSNTNKITTNHEYIFYLIKLNTFNILKVN